MISMRGDQLLVFGGVYSNLSALEAVIALADSLTIPAEQIIFTGDCVAYCAEAEASARRLSEFGCHVVAGNCDSALGRGSDSCGCGFDSGSACDLASQKWYAYAKAHLSDEMAAWMARWPERLSFSWAGKAFDVIHGSYTAQNAFVFASDMARDGARHFADTDADVVLAGHAGVPFMFRHGARTWINAGVIGMPANDGTRDGWVCVLTRERGGIGVSFRRLSYDVMASVDAMRRADLLPAYQQALLSGVWPAHDVMGEAERLQTGVPLRFSDVLIP